MRFAVLVSGRGSNLAALLDARDAGRLAPARISLVVSNRPRAPALHRARAGGVDAIVVDHTLYETRTAFESALLAELGARQVEGVVLAGFMRVLTAHFVSAFPHRILNTHPSLLPAFPGMHAAKQALEHGVAITGCTIHMVDTGVDTGPIIAQAAVRVRADDTPATLQARIQAEEHQLLPESVRALAAGELTVEGRRVLRASDADE